MLATDWTAVGAWAGVIGVLCVVGGGVTRAVTQTMKTHQMRESDTRSVYERLYGRPANPRTGEPAVKGWTVHVDETLDSHGETLSKVSGDVGQILSETRRNAKLAQAEVKEQAKERGRVADRESGD